MMMKTLVALEELLALEQVVLYSDEPSETVCHGNQKKMEAMLLILLLALNNKSYLHLQDLQKPL